MKKKSICDLKRRIKQVVTVITILVLGTICRESLLRAEEPVENARPIRSNLCILSVLATVRSGFAPISLLVPPAENSTAHAAATQQPSAGTIPKNVDLDGDSPYLGTRKSFTHAEQIIRGSIDHLESFRSISAEIQLQINLFGNTYKGTGKYEELISHPLSRKQSSQSNLDFQNTEHGQGDRFGSMSPLEWTQFRLHVKMLPTEGRRSQSGQQENTLEIVCDRHALWTYTLIEGNARLTQLNLEDLANTLNQLSDDKRKELFENGVESPCGTSGLPGLGGLAGLLKRLLVDYHFNSKPEEIRARNGSSAAWVVTGVLKSRKFTAYKDFFLGKPSNNRFELLESIPTHVVLYIGKQSPFPYSIRYYNSIECGQNDTRYPSVKNNNPTPFFTVDYGPVLENPAFLQPKNFVYGPPALNFEKINDAWLKSMIPSIEL
ncbi:MAG: hypothetical protein PHQ75_14825 [Thermoguttaceae bacterium]|nr:hypothetical protein [Thermoguttaceae bacterium]